MSYFPVLPACLADAGDLTLVGQFSEANTAQAILAQYRVRTAAQTATGVSAGGEFGLSLLFEFHAKLCHLILPPLLLKGHAQQGEQLFALFVSLGAGNENDFHAANLLNLLVLDFGEDQLFTQAQGVVTAAIEGLG